MGVSFKIAKTGTRYKPKLVQIHHNDNDTSLAHTQVQGGFVANHTNVMANPGPHSELEDLEVSFSLNLFPNGFCLGKSSEVFDDVPRQLHPYDRASKTLFSAIEYGWLPRDILDDIPCKFMNGALQCEVRDYRKCLFRKADSGSAQNSPIVHRVKLHMCMENVVKDLSSLSDDSWTYRDLLEAESCILKALQPDLQLNPIPSLDRKPFTKKLDLGITWSWRKRELCVLQTFSPSLNNPYKDKRVPCLEQLDSSLNPNLPNKNVTLSFTSLSNHLTPEPNCQMTDSSNQSVLNLLKNKPNFLSVSSQCVVNNSDPRRASSSGIEDMGHILKKPKTEPVEFNLDSELQWKSSLVLSQGNNEQFFVKHMPKLLAKMPLNLKQEPAETRKLIRSEVGKRNDADAVMYQMSNQYNHQQSYVQHPSLPIRTNAPTNALSTQMDQHIGKKPRKSTNTPKRKSLMSPQVPVGASSCYSEFVQSEASGPGKQKKNHCPNGSTLEDSLGCTSNSIVLYSNSLLFDNHLLPQALTSFDPLFGRFLKIKATTQRYELNKQKRKSDQPLRNKPIFHPTPLIASYILDCDDSKTSERTLTFIHSGNETPKAYCESRLKLIMSENLNERMVETSFLYHYTKETKSIDVPIEPSFPSTRFMDLFVAQFKSLMVREGYILGSDQIEPTLLKNDGSSSTQQLCFTRSGIPKAETAPRSSLLLHNISTISASLLSQNVRAGTLSANSLSKSDLDTAAKASIKKPKLRSMKPHNPFSELDMSPRQQIFDKRAHLQSQMQQMERQQEQIVQKKTVAGGLSLANYADNMMNLSSMGRQVPWMGGLSQLNSLGNNLFSESKQYCSGNAAFDDPVAVLAHMRGPESRGSGGLIELQQHQEHQEKEAEEAMSSELHCPETGYLLEHVVGLK